MALERAPLLTPSQLILNRLPESIDKALIEIERRSTPSTVKPNAVYKSPEFRNGAWQLYSQVIGLVPEILPTMRDRRTIKKRFERQKKEFPMALESILSYSQTILAPRYF